MSSIGFKQTILATSLLTLTILGTGVTAYKLERDRLTRQLEKSKKESDTEPSLIYSAFESSIGKVIIKDRRNKTVGIGTAFLTEMEGARVFLTSQHIFEQGSKFLLEIGGRTYQVGTEETLIFQHRAEDAAFFLAPQDLPNDIKPILLSKEDKPIGQKITKIGFPLGLNKTLTTGIVTSKIENFYQYNAPTSPGSSGSPLISPEGEAIGIATAIHILGQNINFATKSTQINKIKDYTKLKDTPSWRTIENKEFSFKIEVPTRTIRQEEEGSNKIIVLSRFKETELMLIAIKNENIKTLPKEKPELFKQILETFIGDIGLYGDWGLGERITTESGSPSIWLEGSTDDTIKIAGCVLKEGTLYIRSAKGYSEHKEIIEKFLSSFEILDIQESQEN